jgi:replication factor C subunit 2/4
LFVDLRHALNNLQSTSAGLGAITADNVFKVVDQPHPLTVKAIIDHCSRGDIQRALLDLQGLWNSGYATIDIVGTFFRVTKSAPIDEKLKLQFIKVNIYII